MGFTRFITVPKTNVSHNFFHEADLSRIFVETGKNHEILLGRFNTRVRDAKSNTTTLESIIIETNHGSEVLI